MRTKTASSTTKSEPKRARKCASCGAIGQVRAATASATVKGRVEKKEGAVHRPSAALEVLLIQRNSLRGLTKTTIKSSPQMNSRRWWRISTSECRGHHAPALKVLPGRERPTAVAEPPMPPDAHGSTTAVMIARRLILGQNRRGDRAAQRVLGGLRVLPAISIGDSTVHRRVTASQREMIAVRATVTARACVVRPVRLRVIVLRWTDKARRAVVQNILLGTKAVYHVMAMRAGGTIGDLRKVAVRIGMGMVATEIGTDTSVTAMRLVRGGVIAPGNAAVDSMANALRCGMIVRHMTAKVHDSAARTVRHGTKVPDRVMMGPALDPNVLDAMIGAVLTAMQTDHVARVKAAGSAAPTDHRAMIGPARATTDPIRDAIALDLPETEPAPIATTRTNHVAKAAGSIVLMDRRAMMLRRVTAKVAASDVRMDHPAAAPVGTTKAGIAVIGVPIAKDHRGRHAASNHLVRLPEVRLHLASATLRTQLFDLSC
jgi:hypothetical protein